MQKEVIYISEIRLKTSVTYKGTGSQTQYDFPFDYLRKSFIKVTIDDVLQDTSDYIVDNRSILFNTAPAADSIIVIYRETDTERLVSWADASVLKASDMTISQVQQLHILEEGQDWSKLNSIYLDETDNAWEGSNHRVKNVRYPVDNNDVVTKGYMETVQGSFVVANTALKEEATKQAGIATTKASEASSSANAAKTSETNAASSENLAKRWAEASDSPDGTTSKSAKTWAGEASASASAAKTSETNAKSSETNAASSASTATDKATIATTKASEASASASAAKTSETNAKSSEESAASSASTATSEANRSKEEADRSYYYPLTTIIGKTPNYYKRPSIPTPNKTKITVPANTQVNIGNKGYVSTQDTVLELSSVGTADVRKGKDVYIYACQPADTNSTVPVFVLSMNSTVPDGYTADNSRKIGGFHCLCRNVGNISGHAASGYVIGDIIPISVWDLLHRAQSENEGMIYADFDGRWYDIYLAGIVGGKLVSQYGAIIADGSSSPAYSGEKFVEEFAKVKKRPLYRNEFMVLAKGSNEGTNIYGSSDPNTAGGHNDTAGRAMISNYFMEEMCGALWQWGADTFEYYPGATWSSGNFYLSGYNWQEKSVYNPSIDSQKYGSCFGLLRRALLGGNWGDGGYCGSRCVYCTDFSAAAGGSGGSRGSSEPRVVNF